MNDQLTAEPPLVTAQERLAVAVALICDYDYLDPQVTPQELAAVALRAQLITAAAASLTQALAGLTRRTVLPGAAATGEPPGVPDADALERARIHLATASEKLASVHDCLGAARKHLRLAETRGLAACSGIGGVDA
jgi:hypothetical protein